jgi:hypothetical protein
MFPMHKNDKKETLKFLDAKMRITRANSKENMIPLIAFCKNACFMKKFGQLF